jgi:hypothetical protein
VTDPPSRSQRVFSRDLERDTFHRDGHRGTRPARTHGHASTQKGAPAGENILVTSAPHRLSRVSSSVSTMTHR